MCQVVPDSPISRLIVALEFRFRRKAFSPVNREASSVAGESLFMPGPHGRQ